MKDVTISISTLSLLLAVVGGGAFAAGRGLTGDWTASSGAPDRDKPELAARESQDPREWQEREQVEEGEPLPPGHPPIDDQAVEHGAGLDTVEDEPGGEQAPIQWKAPPRWRLVPNASAMRLATYSVPRAPGDAADAEVSIARAGGSVDANAERWIRQFDSAGQAPAKRTMRKVGGLDVAIVEVRGTFLGGMGKDGQPHPGWMLLGAIVSTPTVPCFVKLTGPAKSVLAARGEFDAFIGSLVLHEERGT